MIDVVKANGLEEVEAATTRLSDVDGEGGRLSMGGRPVEELAGKVTFEEIAFFLFHGRDASPAEAAEVQRGLAAGRALAFEAMGSLGDAMAMADPMDALRAATSHLSARPGESAFAEALRIAGAVGAFATSWAPTSPPGRDRRDLEPDENARHAPDLLRLATGAAPSAAAADALDAYLVTVVDHGMNASTFAARVVASTASDTVSAVVAALGALKGKLHGGAPGPVLDMLDAIDEQARSVNDPVDDARAWIEGALGRGERIMGMGHRVYRVRDPRAFVLERAIGRLGASAVASDVAHRLALARAVETAAQAALATRHPERKLMANVEFYTAVILEAVGIPRPLFTPTFAAARTIGWCAHVDEQRRTGRLIRPKSRYVAAPALVT